MIVLTVLALILIGLGILTCKLSSRSIADEQLDQYLRIEYPEEYARRETARRKLRMIWYS
jgi:hypothetical protein